jgi:hypothetical protein
VGITISETIKGPIASTQNCYSFENLLLQSAQASFLLIFQGTAMQRCPQGHYYDPTRYSRCLVCGIPDLDVLP